MVHTDETVRKRDLTGKEVGWNSSATVGSLGALRKELGRENTKGRQFSWNVGQ